MDLRSVSIVAPLRRREGGYLSRRIDVHLPPACAQALKDLRDGLREQLAPIPIGPHAGRPVESTQEALVWLLHQLTQPERRSDEQGNKPGAG